MVGIRKFHMVGLLVGACMLGCGGGGGGGGSASYAGTWSVNARLTLNECGVAVEPTVSHTVIVNQDGNRIVANVGSVVMEGEVNDLDGFTAVNVTTSSDGCQVGAGYVFGEASDGEARAVFAIIVRCGIRECRIGYLGTGRRISTRLSDSSSIAKNSTDDIVNALAEGIATTGGVPSEGTLEERLQSSADEVFAGQ
jgi:hypothetical protein